VASLCCLTPLMLVLLGAASISTAAGMDDVLSGKYAWAFRVGGLVFVGVALWVYFKRRGVCTLDAVRRQRNRIVSTVLLTVLFGTAGYIAFNYILLDCAAAGLPWAVENWAIPAGVIVFVAGCLLYWASRWLRR
jgi:hypothetical protein